MANAITYIKNVGKSIGYASIEVFKEKNPVFADFADTNGELVTEMYKSIRDLKKTIKNLPNKIMESEYGKFAETYKNNLLEDLKSGKFYNKERKDSYMSESAGGDDIDMSVFDDFGEGGDDFDVSELEDDDIPSSNEMMDIVGEKSSAAVSMAVARSSEYIVEANTQIAKASYKQNNAIYGGLHKGMATINQNIARIIEFSNENMNLHFENSKNFYSTITELDNARNDYLKEISETLKSINNPQSTAQNQYKTTKYSDLISGEGVVDIAKFGKFALQNLKNNTVLGELFDALDMFTQEDGMVSLKNLADSPLEFLAEGIVNYLIPQTLEKYMERINKSISGLAGNALLGLRKKEEKGGIWSFLLDVFNIDTGIKDSINTKNYEKGKVPFDGMTRKAIIEVIPTYLSKILSTLTGKERDVFDLTPQEKFHMDMIRSLDHSIFDKVLINIAMYDIND